MRIFKRFTIALTGLQLLLLSMPGIALADGKINQLGTGIGINAFLIKIRGYLLGFAGALAIIFIVYGGGQMMISRGNPQKLETAKKTLTYAIIGLIVVILAQAILILLTGSGGAFQKIFGTGTASL
jgi:hypothetical protein